MQRFRVMDSNLCAADKLLLVDLRKFIQNLLDTTPAAEFDSLEIFDADTGILQGTISINVAVTGSIYSELEEFC